MAFVILNFYTSASFCQTFCVKNIKCIYQVYMHYINVVMQTKSICSFAWTLDSIQLVHDTFCPFMPGLCQAAIWICLSNLTFPSFQRTICDKIEAFKKHSLTIIYKKKKIDKPCPLNLRPCHFKRQEGKHLLKLAEPAIAEI